MRSGYCRPPLHEHVPQLCGNDLCIFEMLDAQCTFRTVAVEDERRMESKVGVANEHATKRA
jgi:hypothetical protein